MANWTLTQLTFGTEKNRFHSHSYYDIAVMDKDGARLLVHRMGFAGHQPTAQDAVEVGVVDIAEPGSFASLGESRAWSWQQGPMAQWVGGGGLAIYNDREDGAFVARLVDTRTGSRRTLPRPVYAVAPDGKSGLCLNMARLDTLRPGYGYPEGGDARLKQEAPKEDGVWRIDFETGEAKLLLSLDEARDFVLYRLGVRRQVLERLRRPHYWFNHVKISPDGKRFTVKLRWRRPGKGWNDKQGVSLTGSMEGGDLRFLARATSHVVWLNNHELYAWRMSEVVLLGDRNGKDNRLRRIAPELLQQNVHMRHLPPGPTPVLGEAVFDTPYREDIKLLHYDDRSGHHEVIAKFGNHRPARGPFRCDLHPVPSEDGRTVIVTSMQDGGRQVYALHRG
ncbi:hypothetical protein [Parvularcula oceani]|uniref:hypothetical protein n=1 Tax=Parvularcula oceani TaxID=1247963 RepID=UPI0004E10EEA|nr:hypothetical protein [Parvularcula oceani]